MANARFPWWPDWHGQTAVIVGSGASASKAKLSLAKDKSRFIAVNESWRLAPWADALYGSDSNWWRKTSGLEKFGGLKISQAPQAVAFCQDVKRVYAKPKCDDILLSRIGTIGWGGNSGFQALNLAVQFGANRIVIIGFDMHGNHWHGPHKRGLRNPSGNSFAHWIKALEGNADGLRRLGIVVLNASTSSAITVFPKISFESEFPA